ncbi:MAG: hypothetical protein P9M15_02690 [Candidatus Electryoneaceae bacterium]|nr:hypothetical protein [Candidatus Electryoneaceae bacterium]
MIFRIIGILLLMTAKGIAGPAEDAWNAYLSGNFAHVEMLTTVAFGDTTLSNGELARIFLAWGCSEAIRGRSVEAVGAFETALTLDPTIEMTSTDLPPPVWRLYEPVRQRMPKQIVTPPLGTVSDTIFEPLSVTMLDTVELIIPVYRDRSVSLRSLLYPGWGHWVEDRHSGWIYAGVETLMITGWVLSAIKADRARDDYLSDRQPDEIETSYNHYNNYYRLSWGFAIGAIATYVVAQVDFFSAPPPISLDENSIRLSWAIKL